jgi:hypothetical protein
MSHPHIAPISILFLELKIQENRPFRVDCEKKLLYLYPNGMIWMSCVLLSSRTGRLSVCPGDAEKVEQNLNLKYAFR